MGHGRHQDTPDESRRHRRQAIGRDGEALSEGGRQAGDERRCRQAARKSGKASPRRVAVTGPEDLGQFGAGRDCGTCTADHRAVEALFVRFEKTGDRAFKQREQLVEQISVQLSRHAAIEETVFYPAIRAEAPDAETSWRRSKSTISSSSRSVSWRR